MGTGLSTTGACNHSHISPTLAPSRRAADGKIRVFNLLTGECVRIFRGNSHCDPIVNLSFSGPRALCVNTTSSMHMLNFEEK